MVFAGPLCCHRLSSHPTTHPWYDLSPQVLRDNTTNNFQANAHSHTPCLSVACIHAGMHATTAPSARRKLSTITAPVCRAMEWHGFSLPSAMTHPQGQTQTVESCLFPRLVHGFRLQGTALGRKWGPAGHVDPHVQERDGCQVSGSTTLVRGARCIRYAPAPGNHGRPLSCRRPKTF